MVRDKGAGEAKVIIVVGKGKRITDVIKRAPQSRVRMDAVRAAGGAESLPLNYINSERWERLPCRSRGFFLSINNVTFFHVLPSVG